MTLLPLEPPLTASVASVLEQSLAIQHRTRQRRVRPASVGNVMEKLGNAPSPISALWIGSSNAMLNRTSAITNKLFPGVDFVHLGELLSASFSTLTPGHAIILEFDDSDKTDGWIDESIRLIMRIQAVVEKPSILCVGHHIEAEVVVDWVRAGALSYVEKTADERHLWQAFQSLAHESVKFQSQYHRYEKLMRLWNSITEREACVLGMVMEGLPNKKIANNLGVSQRTIEARRQKLYEKLDSRSVVDVVRTIFELESLDNVFHRIDAVNDLDAARRPRASRLLRSLPLLHSEDSHSRPETP